MKRGDKTTHAYVKEKQTKNVSSCRMELEKGNYDSEFRQIWDQNSPKTPN